MNSISIPATAGDIAPLCVVWLPGAYQSAHDFLTAGFDRAVQARDMAIDLQFVDLQMAHLTDRSVLERLRNEIIKPARTSGVRVWLGGISLGGLLALDLAASHPDEFDGLCLFSPYLGNRTLTAEIAAARGLAAWQPGEHAQGDEERRIWSYIKSRATDAQPLHLGFGRDDRFAPAHELLAAALPASAVDVVPGGHDWPTWRKLWENFLELRLP
jgi:pimeloyl-ACP methyl ester carboxylesterase